MAKSSILKTSILLCLLITGCSSFGGSGSSTLSREVETLKARVLELQQGAVVDRLEIERLRARINDLETGRWPQSQPAASAEAGSPARSRGIGEEELPPPRQLTSIEETDLEERPEPPPGEPAPAADSADTEVPAAAQALYDLGYTLYHQGRYLEAEQNFSRFLEMYGATDLADNAQYWIGESRLARGELPSALAAFRETVARYPQGNKAPDAQLKVGRVLESLGDLDGARRAYTEVQDRYPVSSASESAAERLRAF